MPTNAEYGQYLLEIASGMLVAFTGVWSVSFFIVGVALSKRLLNLASTNDKAKKTLAKVVVGTISASVISLAYSLLVLCGVFIYPPEYFPVVETSVKFNWAEQTLKIALGAILVWLIRPLHESEGEESPEDTDSKMKFANTQSQQSANMSLTLDVDD